jgi:hypothetical protein
VRGKGNVQKRAAGASNRVQSGMASPETDGGGNAEGAPGLGRGSVFGSVTADLDRQSRFPANSPIRDCHPAPVAQFLADAPSAKLSAENDRFRQALAARALSSVA